VLSQAVGGAVDTEMAVTTTDTAQVFATQASVAATGTTVRKKRPKRGPWLYVVDVPGSQEAVHSITRSGYFFRICYICRNCAITIKHARSALAIARLVDTSIPSH